MYYIFGLPSNHNHLQLPVTLSGCGKNKGKLKVGFITQ
jgi:hypothetical protein